MADSYMPLRWESTGDQWWFASPIDWAAANGQYAVVRELLRLDANLLINLTSLRRIRRLETVWDDDSRFADIARCRASVARSLFLECETKNSGNSLVRAGYGGWLLYTAASAGDGGFVHELLDRDALLVFGEGEYGVTDMLYAAARSGNASIFRALLDFALRGHGVADEPFDGSCFRHEMVNRAVHAAARGGSVELLKELLEGCGDVSAFRDMHGSTVLHAAAGRGQLAVVNYLLSTFDVADARDGEGNTVLHVAAFRGHLPVVDMLIVRLQEHIASVNNAGDTFFHRAVAGFQAPGFRRVDRRLALIKHLFTVRMAEIDGVVNLPNKDGRTVLHMAVVGNAHPELVKLLMTVPSIDLNARDVNGFTPLGLLKQLPRSANSEMLIKQFVSAGGVSGSSARRSIDRSAIATELRMQFASSPGTTFSVSDAEIIQYAGVCGCESRSSCSSACKTDEVAKIAGAVGNRRTKVNRAADRVKILLKWAHRKDDKTSGAAGKRSANEDGSMKSLQKMSQSAPETATSLRQRFSKPDSLNGKRALAVRCSSPNLSPSARRKKHAVGLMHGVMEAMQRQAPNSDMKKGNALQRQETSPASSSALSVSKREVRCGSGSLFCFGAQGLTVEDSITGQRSSLAFKKPSLATA